MRSRIAALFLVVATLAAGIAAADHFDGDAATGSFNPIMTLTTSQGLVNRPTDFSLRITQVDHEDPPIYAAFRAPGDWQFAWESVRRPETAAGVPTARCSDAIDGYRNSPNGTGTGTQLDFSKRTDARFARAEKIGRGRLRAHADGVSRPAAPIEWNGDVAFISYDPATQTGEVCALLVTTDTRVTTIPDPSPEPSDDRDDIEGVTEIVAQFGISRVTDATGTYWQTLVDNELADLIKSSELQTLHASLIELKADFNGMSTGNWQVGGAIPFSKTPATSGAHSFQGVFKTCPANDPAFGDCKSGRPDAVRTIGVTVTLPAPTIDGPANGSLLNTNPVAVTGTAVDSGSSVQVYSGGVAAGSPVTVGADRRWTASVPLSDGAHTLTAKVVDAGGASVASNARSITLDTTPPAAPAIASPAQDALVGGTTVAVSGTAEPGSRVELVDVAVPVGSTTAGPSGAWSISTTLAKGPHALSARATDVAGNAGEFGPVRAFDVTTASPAVIAPTQSSATNASTVTFTGTAEPGATVSLEESGAPLGTPALASPSDGSWSIGVSLAEGSYDVVAIAAKDGFVSPPAPVRSFAVDFTPPAAPAISSPAAGETVRSITVTLRGTAEPGSSVAILERSVRLGSGAAGADGSWAAVVVLGDGEHRVRALATDRAGNTGPASPDLTFVVDDPLEITSPAAGTTVDGTVEFAGGADPASSEVRLFEGGLEIGRAPVVDGAWALTVSMPSGGHTVQARSVTDGVVGPLGPAHSFVVDAAPPKVIIKKPSGWLVFGRLIADPLRGTVTDANPFDSRVVSIDVVYENVLTGVRTASPVACSSCPATSASWAHMPQVDPGFYEVTVTARDGVGNESSATELFLIV